MLMCMVNSTGGMRFFSAASVPATTLSSIRFMSFMDKSPSIGELYPGAAIHLICMVCVKQPEISVKNVSHTFAIQLFRFLIKVKKGKKEGVFQCRSIIFRKIKKLWECKMKKKKVGNK